jgi:hypothetical protein
VKNDILNLTYELDNVACSDENDGGFHFNHNSFNDLRTISLDNSE